MPLSRYRNFIWYKVHVGQRVIQRVSFTTDLRMAVNLMLLWYPMMAVVLR
jgi:hypothetical protein